MGILKFITVEVVYASPSLQKLITVQVKDGAMIIEVIQQSGILEIFPEINLEQQKVGIFSQPKLLTDTVREGDRIEIYRALVMDPKEARRKRGK